VPLRQDPGGSGAKCCRHLIASLIQDCSHECLSHCEVQGLHCNKKNAQNSTGTLNPTYLYLQPREVRRRQLRQAGEAARCPT